MEAAVRTNARFPRSLTTQTGFSMVELLMTAFILAIGLLGLTALQSLSLRSAAGSRGLSTAVLIGERAMDQILSNGRESLAYARSVPAVTPPAALTAVFTAPVADRTFNFAGRPSVGDPQDTTPFFTLSVQSQPAAAGAVAAIPRFGGVSNMVVTVRWQEDSAAPARQVVISRRVAYATAI